MTHNTVPKSSGILFRIVPVTIHHGQQSVETLAFLDEGSAVTLVEAELARTLGVTGQNPWR